MNSPTILLAFHKVPLMVAVDYTVDYTEFSIFDTTQRGLGIGEQTVNSAVDSTVDLAVYGSRSRVHRLTHRVTRRRFHIIIAYG